MNRITHMKYENHINLFWLCTWSMVLTGSIVATFWEPAIFFVAGIATVMAVMFLYDFIRITRMK